MAFAGKVALVTGSAGALGLALAKELLKNDAKGVALVDISESNGLIALQQLEEFGTSRAIFIKTDITDQKQFEEAFEKTVSTYHQLDLVINNAGIVNELDGWDESLEVNLVGTMRGSYLAMQKYLPKYKSGSEGVIANTASIFGLGTFPSMPAYIVSKHGIVALGQTLGLEEFYETYGVKVVTICPGAVATNMFARAQNKVLFPQSYEQEIQKTKAIQTPEYLAENYIKIIESGQNGSVWVIEDNEPPYEVVIPDRKAMRRN